MRTGEGIRDGYRQQARVRVGIGVFMGLYFAFTTFIAHPLYHAFVLYAVASFFYARHGRFAAATHGVLVASLLADTAFTVASLFVVEAHGYFLFLILIQICFGYGVRYGTGYLWSATVVVCTGILALFTFSPYWHARPFEAISFLVGVPFLALYVHVLSLALKASRDEAAAQAETNRRLLRFVSHDIRTQLQAMLHLTDELGARTSAARVASTLHAMQDSIRALARIAGDFLSDSLGPGPHDEAAVPAIEVIDLATWCGRLCARYMAELRLHGISLRVRFAPGLPRRIAVSTAMLERLLLNALSNAVRHAYGGSIRLELATCQAGDGSPALRLELVNRSPHAFESGRATDVGAPSLHGSGLGHAISRELASSLGGGFTARRVDATTYCTVIEVPCPRIPQGDARPFAQPVLCCSATPARGVSWQAALATTANLFAWPDVEAAARGCEQPDAQACTWLFDVPALECWTALAPALPPDERLRHWCQVVVHEAPVADAVAPQWPYLCMAGETGTELEQAVRFAAACNGAGATLADVLPNTVAAAVGRGLYLEDSRFSAEHLRAAVQPYGLELDHVTTTAEACARLTTAEYDFILMDWELDGETGAELLRALRADAVLYTLPVVILSAHRAEELRPQLAAVPVFEIVEKPIDPARLVHRIARCRGQAQTQLPALPARAADIFAAETYTAAATTPAARLEQWQLLGTLLAELDALLARLAATPADAVAVERVLHRLLGLADVGGARWLATEVRAAQARCRDGQALAPGIGDALRAVGAVTAAHVRAFRATLHVA